VLIGLSVLLYAALEFSSRWEQAKTPGEKNMGVAVLFMIFGIPMLISAAAGLLCLSSVFWRLLMGGFSSAFQADDPQLAGWKA
jgi:hypothetical protein